MGNNLKTISMNCRGLNGKQKRRDVLHHVRIKKASISCLQNFRFTSNMEAMVKAERGGEVVFSSLASNFRWVAIFFSDNLDYKIHDKK